MPKEIAVGTAKLLRDIEAKLPKRTHGPIKSEYGRTVEADRFMATWMAVFDMIGPALLGDRNMWLAFHSDDPRIPSEASRFGHRHAAHFTIAYFMAPLHGDSWGWAQSHKVLLLDFTTGRFVVANPLEWRDAVHTKWNERMTRI